MCTEDGADTYSVWNQYERPDGAYILIRVTEVSKVFYDTEDVTVEQFEINGCTATLTGKQDYNNIVWANPEGGYSVRIITDGIDKADAIRVAENLHVEFQ